MNDISNYHSFHLDSFESYRYLWISGTREGANASPLGWSPTDIGANKRVPDFMTAYIIKYLWILLCVLKTHNLE